METKTNLKERKKIIKSNLCVQFVHVNIKYIKLGKGPKKKEEEKKKTFSSNQKKKEHQRHERRPLQGIISPEWTTVLLTCDLHRPSSGWYTCVSKEEEKKAFLLK